MSERTRGSTVNGAHPEAHDLRELHASKTQEALRHQASDPANTDLSSASIQSISVVRLSTRPEKRRLSSLSVPPTADREGTTERDMERHPGSRRGENHGILKNPYFPYKGGPLERLITLLANVLKYVERSILASLRPQTPQAPTPNRAVKTKKKDASGREIDEDSDRPEQSETPLKSSPR